MGNFKLANDIVPYLSQTFFSLEGEGMTVGRAALFLRINGCNACCTFCDTSFSIAGNPKYNIVDMTSPDFEVFLEKEYEHLNKLLVSSVTITGGEPLKNILQYSKMFEKIFNVFPSVSHIIFETNGTYLSDEKNCLAIMKQLNKFNKKFTLSISPKLSGLVSWNGVPDEEVFKWYINIIHNYSFYLNRHFNIQLKFIYFNDPKLDDINQRLINLCLDSGIHHSKILIMPLTPRDPLGKNEKVWKNSKDLAAKYALKNHFRYSPRIHIDRKLD